MKFKCVLILLVKIFLTNGMDMDELRQIGTPCIRETKQVYPDLNVDDVLKFHVFEYSDASPESHREFIRCYLTKAKFYDTERKIINVHLFQNVFNKVDPNVIENCVGEMSNAENDRDRAFLPFLCVLNQAKREILNTFFGTDDVYDNPDHHKNSHRNVAEWQLKV